MKQAVLRTGPGENDWFVAGQANTPAEFRAQREHQEKQEELQKKDPGK